MGKNCDQNYLNFTTSSANTNSQLPHHPIHSQPTLLHTIPNFNITSVLPAVGLLRVNWFKNGQLTCINYGTAFLVAERLLLTCAHNLYDQKHGFCSQILFIPGIESGPIQLQKTYKSVNTSVFYMSNRTNKSFAYRPLKQQLCMVILQQKVMNTSLLKIGKPRGQFGEQLLMVGYPSKKYGSIVNLNYVKTERSILSGKFHSQQQHIINYTIKTSVGLSGSPIIKMKQNGQYYVVGIHTHHGLTEQFNSGLLFTDQIINTIGLFQAMLCQTFRLQKQITYLTIDYNHQQINQKIQLQDSSTGDSDNHSEQIISNHLIQKQILFYQINNNCCYYNSQDLEWLEYQSNQENKLKLKQQKNQNQIEWNIDGCWENDSLPYLQQIQKCLLDVSIDTNVNVQPFNNPKISVIRLKFESQFINQILASKTTHTNYDLQGHIF